MMKKRIRKNNKGFSMVEMIIVIAIIAVLSAAGFVTVTLIHSAKAKEAAVTFESELSAAIGRAKSQMVVIKDESTGVVNEYPRYLQCLEVYKATNGKYYIKKGYKNPDATGEAAYIFVDSENGHDGNGKSLSGNVYVCFKAKGTSNVLKIDNSGADTIEKVRIVFDKAGRCIEGAGTFEFHKNSGSNVAEVALKSNGSYQAY